MFMKRVFAWLALLAFHFSAAATEPILIGQTADLSSVSSAQMKDFNAAAKVYLHGVNKAGGIKGRPIQLIHLDDAMSAHLASVNARELIEEQKVLAIFGTRGTDPTEAVLAVADAARVPVIAPISGADTVRKSPVAFPVRASYRLELDTMFKQMAFAPVRLAMLVQNDKFGHPLARFTQARLQQQYPTISLVKQAFFDRKCTDMRAQVSTILASQPNAVIALCNPTSCEAFLREIQKQTRHTGATRPTIYQTSISDAYSQFSAMQADFPGGSPFTQILPDPVHTTAPLAKEYRAALKGQGIPINYRSFEGYVAAKVLVMALSKAATLTREGLIQSMEQMGTRDLGGFTVHYAKGNHLGSTFVDLVTLNSTGQIVH